MDLPLLSIRVRRLAQEYRRRWRRIGQQSARKRTTRWTRHYHRALVGALLVSLPLVFAGEALVDHLVITVVHNGDIARMPEGDFVASVVKPETNPPSPPTLWGNYTMSRIGQHRGWPFGSVERVEPMRVMLNDFNIAGTTPASDHPDGAAIRSAIEAALVTKTDSSAPARVLSGISEAGSRRSLSATVANFLVVFVILACAAALVTRGGDLFERVRRDRRRLIGKERRQTGQCAECGYNLRGLEYHGRCPECGSLLH